MERTRKRAAHSETSTEGEAHKQLFQNDAEDRLTMRLQVTIAFLLGVVATLLAVLVFAPHNQIVLADGQGMTSAGGGMFGITGNADPGGKNLLWIVDSKSDTPRLCLYEWENGRLLLHAARNIRYDFMYDQFPGKPNAHRPTVEEVYKETEQQRQKNRQEQDKQEKKESGG